MNNGCKDCDKRYPGCHDHCETYLAWKEELLKQKKRTSDDKYADYLMMAMQKERKTKRERQKKYNGR